MASQTIVSCEWVACNAAASKYVKLRKPPFAGTLRNRNGVLTLIKSHALCDKHAAEARGQYEDYAERALRQDISTDAIDRRSYKWTSRFVRRMAGRRSGQPVRIRCSPRPQSIFTELTGNE
jgi:hypothetical protein